VAVRLVVVVGQWLGRHVDIRGNMGGFLGDTVCSEHFIFILVPKATFFVSRNQSRVKYILSNI